MVTRPIRLAVVDDHLLIRKTLVIFLSDQINIHVVAQASDISELFSQFKVGYTVTSYLPRHSTGSSVLIIKAAR
jgi:hypothetical protein